MIEYNDKASMKNECSNPWEMKVLPQETRGKGLGIYVTDADSDELLYLDEALRQKFGIEDLKGMKCYQAFQPGRKERCANCPVDRLMNGEKRQAYLRWEEHNKATGEVFENCDVLFDWVNGKRIHIQLSRDVTEERKLLWEARYDELTGVYSRRSGKKKMEDILDKADKYHIPISLCLFDLNDLKEINDLYGHAEGDTFIQIVIEAVKWNLEEGQFVMRLSGDEFLIMLPGLYETDAEKKVHFIKDRLLRQQQELGKEYEFGFCYGILEVLPGSDRNLNKLLTLVDEKMYQQKRYHHIRKAQQVQDDPGVEDVPLEAELNVNRFYYDREKLYDALASSVDDYVYVCNMQTGMFRYPAKMVDEFDLPGEVVENAAAVWAERIHPVDRQVFLEANQEVMDGRCDNHSVEYRARNCKGEWVWLRCRGKVERDEKGEPVIFAGIITNLGQKNKYDHMTGLENRFVLEERVEQLIAKDMNQRLGILLLGMDDFRHINDLYNRNFGDEVIRITAQKIQSILPPSASLYRFDGDAYVVLFWDTAQQELWLFYKELQSIFERQQCYDGKKYFTLLSGGGAFYPEDGESYQEVMKHAAYSLEYSKCHGKNQLTFYSKEIMKHQERNLELTEILRESVEHGFDGFSLHYQPFVRAQEGEIFGAEALARFTCKKYGAIPPSEFIPLLEESSLILPVGQWVLEKAMETAARWRRIVPEFQMSINISWLQLEHPAFLDILEKKISEKQMDTSQIILELTESYIAANYETVRTSFERLHNLGFRIAMDDFGTGYSSLGILKMADVDYVKIDRTFIKDVISSPFDVTFVEFIVKLCHDMDIQVVLEGIETEEQLELIADKEIDLYQGFYFSCPVPEILFEKMLQ